MKKSLVLITILLSFNAVLSSETSMSAALNVGSLDSILGVSPLVITGLVLPSSNFTYTINVSALVGNTRMNASCSAVSAIINNTFFEWLDYELMPVELKTNLITITAPASESLFNGTIIVNATNGQQSNISVSLNVTGYSSRLNLTVIDCETMGLVTGALVLFDNNSYSAGVFESPWVMPGSYLVNASKYGYESNATVFNLSAGFNNRTICLVPLHYGNLSASPESISVSLSTSVSETAILTLSNIELNNDALDINLTTNASWIALGKTHINSISADDYEQVGVVINSFSSAGTYYGEIIINSSNSGNLVVPVIVVVSTPAPTPQPSPSPSPGGAVTPITASNISITSSVASLINQSSFNIDYPRELSLVESSSATIYVKVNNNGNVSLDNVWLDLKAPDCVSVIVSPRVYTNIPVSVERLFMVELLATNCSGVTNLNFTVISDYISGDYSIKLNVSSKESVSITGELVDEVNRVDKILNDLETSVSQLRVSGANTTDIEGLIEATFNKMRLIKTAVVNQDNVNVITGLLEVKILLKDINNKVTIAYEIRERDRLAQLTFNNLVMIMLACLTVLLLFAVIGRGRVHKGIISVSQVVRRLPAGERVKLEVIATYFKKTDEGFMMKLSDKTGFIYGLFKNKLRGHYIVDGSLDNDERGRKFILIKRVRK
ncbi:MAG: hypothetical protein WC307_00135 [Candidatus Nanoarchaeia archaeon]